MSDDLPPRPGDNAPSATRRDSACLGYYIRCPRATRSCSSSVISPALAPTRQHVHRRSRRLSPLPRRRRARPVVPAGARLRRARDDRTRGLRHGGRRRQLDPERVPGSTAESITCPAYSGQSTCGSVNYADSFMVGVKAITGQVNTFNLAVPEHAAPVRVRRLLAGAARSSTTRTVAAETPARACPTRPFPSPRPRRSRLTSCRVGVPVGA